MCKIGKMPASVLVDMALNESAPDKRYPYLVVTGPKTKNCSQQGLPDAEEIGALEEMLTTTGTFLTGVTPKVLAGTVTRNCQRLNYYYVKDTTGIRTAVHRLYARNYRNYDFAISIKPDPDWTTYKTFLYPDAETRNWMDNEKIIAGMLLKGDSLNQQRYINFRFYFHSDTDRAAFLTYAKILGYNTAMQTNKDAANAPFEAIVTTWNYVKTAVINPITLDLKKEAWKRRGIYDNWDAPPVKSGDWQLKR